MPDIGIMQPCCRVKFHHVHEWTKLLFRSNEAPEVQGHDGALYFVLNALQYSKEAFLRLGSTQDKNACTDLKSIVWQTEISSGGICH